MANLEQKFPQVPGADSANNVTISDVLGNKTDSVSGDSLVGLVKVLNAAVDGSTASILRMEGKVQIKEFSVTGAANAGVTTVATVTTQPCLIESVVIHADDIQTVDMTSCAVEGGAGQVVEFISAASAIQGNLDAVDKQVGWTGGVRLAATKLITIDLQGTGATAVDLTVTIKYRACVNGGYLA